MRIAIVGGGIFGITASWFYWWSLRYTKSWTN